MFNKTFIIAEAGVNHNGNISIAKKLIKSAKDCGADAIKFQTWAKGEITGNFTKKLSYIENYSSKKSRAQISEDLRLNYSQFKILQNYSKKIGILFLSTPDGFKSLNFLNRDLNIKYIKISSSELNHHEYLKKVAQCRKPVFLSTGMGTLNEVRNAVNILKRYLSNDKIVVMQCTSEYPTNFRDANLNVLNLYKKNFRTHIGFSDHTRGIDASIVAVAMGCKVIEKHFTLNKKMKGPDHKASINPAELKKLIKKVKKVEIIMGSSEKKPTDVEIKNKVHTRRSVVASKKLFKGHVLKLTDMACKRPAWGVQPNDKKKLLGKSLLINLEKDQPIKLLNVKP